MDRVEELLGKRRWNKHCLRANIAKKEDIVCYGKEGSIKVAKVASNVLNNREKEPELYDAIKAVAPEWWDDETQITLNKDVMCQRHRDHANKEHSWILWLGDFTGGALLFDDGTRVEGKGVWHKINGHIYHWNEPHEGSPKYSLVLYRRTRVPKFNRLHAALARKRELAKAQAVSIETEAAPV